MTISKIRDKISSHVGNEVKVVHNEGRNKVFEYRGKVVEVYPNVFIILDNNSKRSFSYYDVLTDTVKVSFKL